MLFKKKVSGELIRTNLIIYQLSYTSALLRLLLSFCKHLPKCQEINGPEEIQHTGDLIFALRLFYVVKIPTGCLRI